MLGILSIRDMVLIEAVDLRFAPGLNVLTGETGAGKSILLDALGFVLGWRVRGDLVRAGAAQGEVTAEFHLGRAHPAQAVLEEAGLPAGETLLLRRQVTADGRRQAWVNDRRVTAETLRALSATLVELHGQQDDRGLLDPSGHRALLDAFAAVDPGPVRAAWTARAAAVAALAEAEAAVAAAARDADFVTHALEELTRLAPEPGEEERLDTRRRQLRAAERIRGDIARAADALGPDGAEGPLLQAARWLETAAEGAEGALLDPAVEGLSRLLDTLSDVARSVEAVLSDLGADPGELEAVEERLFALRALARKHQVIPDDLPALAEFLAGRAELLSDGAGAVARAAARLAGAEAAYAEAAEALTHARTAAARRLDTAMAQELPPLRLDRARFVTEVAPGEPGPLGADRVRFIATTNPGAPPGPIERIASGGELSRFLLALRVCLSARSERLTLIFDEIDRGVGGATADAVGRRLEALGPGRGAQVLVVTHSPQVAARGGHHWRVGKRVADGMTRTEVVPLEPGARTEEIARMLAGDTITEEARAAALALMA